MLELYLSYEEWRLIQAAMIVYSSYQIWGTAQNLFEKIQERRAQKQTDRDRSASNEHGPT